MSGREDFRAETQRRRGKVGWVEGHHARPCFARCPGPEPHQNCSWGGRLQYWSAFHGGCMKRFVIPGLVVVHLLLHALALLTLIGPWFHSAWSDALDLPILMLGPSQGALLAVWIALGGRGTWLRVILAAAGIVAYMACFKPNDPGFAYLGAGEFMGTTICTMVFLGTSLLLARLSGLELTRPARAVPGRPRSQFFIRDILLWTTVLAVVLSAARFLGSKEWHVIDFTDVGLVAALASLPLVAAACLWAALGRERLMAPCPAAVGDRGRGRITSRRTRTAVVGPCYLSRHHGRLAGPVALGGPLGGLSAALAVAVQRQGGRIGLRATQIAYSRTQFAYVSRAARRGFSRRDAGQETRRGATAGISPAAR